MIDDTTNREIRIKCIREPHDTALRREVTYIAQVMKQILDACHNAYKPHMHARTLNDFVDTDYLMN